MSAALDRVAVIGGGLMGSGIAETAAVAGFSVLLCEVDDDRAREARERVLASVTRAAASGRLGDAAASDVVRRIDFTSDLDRLADAELVIEAVPEDLQLKLSVLGAVAERVSPDTVIASNTSSIPIAQLAAPLANPGRVIGMHFFSPVPAMKLVELVVALETKPHAVEVAQHFAGRTGKAAIESKDRSGFIVNLLLVPYLMAAIRMLEEGFASAEAIDAGMRLGCGHPMGPLTLCDFIGLEVLVSVCDSLYEEFKRPDYAPPPLLKRMVASGWYGRKSGRGFYDYSGAQALAA